VWRFRAESADVVVPVKGNLTLNDDEALWQAVLGGLGISLLPTFIVGRDLQAGRLQAVLAQYVPSERTLHAIYLPNRHLSAKVRVFIDFLLARFAAPPYWDRDWVPADREVRRRTRSAKSDRSR
jgi:DNA-binding transcriptional LysR family regulator